MYSRILFKGTVSQEKKNYFIRSDNLPTIQDRHKRKKIKRRIIKGSKYMALKLFSEKLVNNKDDRSILAEAWILANAIIMIIQVLLNLRSIEVIESISEDPELDKMLSDL